MVDSSLTINPKFVDYVRLRESDAAQRLGLSCKHSRSAEIDFTIETRPTLNVKPAYIAYMLGNMQEDPRVSAPAARSVTLQRKSLGHYEARNVRGGTLTVGNGDGADFTPVELLLVALGSCTSADVDYIVSKRAEPESFDVQVTADKIRDEAGRNRLVNLAIELGINFPEGAAGDEAREALPRAAKMSHDRLCTVSRTIELGTPIDTRIVPSSAG
jgi:uncharacterized OsmC-like protein